LSINKQGVAGMLLSVEDQNFEDHVLKIAQDRIIVAYLEGIILCRLRNNQLGGYDLLIILHKSLNLLVSPGTIYSNLYSMERQGLIECIPNGRKRVYRLTDKGKATIHIISHSKKLKNFLDLVNKEICSELKR
jgi:DNA-binding PadR family transcriptional regulator